MSYKILLVSSAFYPEISPRSFRATELAKEFHRQGHEVTVITRSRSFNYDSFLNDYTFKLKFWSENKLPLIPNFSNSFLHVFSRVLMRLLLMLFEYPAIEEMFKVKNALKKESGYDILISFAVPFPVHWGVAWSRKRKHQIAPVWIADCGDPYMGNRLDSFKKLFYFGYIEKWFCKKANFITIPVESAKPAYYKQFHHKIKIIPQGFNFNLNQLQLPFTKNDIPEFAYAGGFLVGIRDPRLLLNYLSEIEKPFRFYVYTNQLNILQEYIPVLKDKLIVSNFIERDELMKKLSKMDFLVNFDNNTQLNVPSKLIDYAITGRPVLNVGKDLIKDDVIDFLNGYYDKRMKLPNPEQYHISRVSLKFLELVKEKF
ncbi:MAG: glycosyltransferase [Marinilabiliaceae bacterium]|nr:glycosyltransferase [Marinilabiliaceae bacterium]